jgi:hypothetical protein
MIPLRRRLADVRERGRDVVAGLEHLVRLPDDLRALAVLIAEALAALDELDDADPAVVQARRKLAEARALLRGT